MEAVYKPSNRPWVSEKISLKEYFLELKAALPGRIKNENEVSKSKPKVEMSKRIMDLMNVPLTEENFRCLEETCSTRHLKVQDEPPPIDVKVVKSRPALYDKYQIPVSASHLETLRHLNKRLTNEEAIGHLKYRSSKWLNAQPIGNKDLEPEEHILVVVRVYHPFRHVPGQRNNQPPKCSQEIILLDSQTLDVLRDKILCPSDLAVKGELSENPDQVLTQRAMDVYKSGFIFVDDTFYNDLRDPNNKDNSEVIRKWADNHNLGPFQTAKLEETKFIDLTVRLGYPYVYQHQGNCEHLLVFSDIRFLHKSDPLSRSSYPVCRSISSTNARYCMICGLYIARWITTENDRVPHDPCFFCEHCFRSFNYIDGKKVGNFKAYPFYDKCAT